jgi:hypothetical protein
MNDYGEKEKEFWIKLLVKYKGKCVACGKEIPQGEHALWSKTSKAIKHIMCEAPQEKDAGKEKPEAKGSHPQTAVALEETLPELNCFICAKTAECSTCSLEVNCNRQMVSQACICESCLSASHAYENYQQAFLAKIAKVKM